MHGAGEIRGNLLGEPGEMRARLPEDVAGVRRELAGDDPHQRRFARAIAPDQADALARIDLEVDVVEHRRAAEGMRKVVEVEQRHEARERGDAPGTVQSRVASRDPPSFQNVDA